MIDFITRIRPYGVSRVSSHAEYLLVSVLGWGDLVQHQIHSAWMVLSKSTIFDVMLNVKYATLLFTNSISIMTFNKYSISYRIT